jgi:hypothetical protein
MNQARRHRPHKGANTKAANRPARLRLVVRGRSPKEAWDCLFRLYRSPKAPPQLWLVRLPGKCANPARRLRRVRPGFYELALRLLGPAMPVEFVNCNESQQARWFAEVAQGLHSHPATIAIFAAAGKIRVGIHQE